jgi:MFS family permease
LAIGQIRARRSWRIGAITLTSEYCPERNRSLLVMVMFCGFTMGGALGGLSAATLIADFGWQGVLLLGGMLPLVLAAVLFFLLPKSVRYLVLKQGQDARVAALLERVDPAARPAGARFVGVRRVEGSPVRQLFASGLGMGTLLLWVTFFISLLVFYLLTNWLPTVLNSAGYTPKMAPLSALMLPVGSTFGAIAIHGTRRLVDVGLMDEQPHVQFVMGVKNVMPAEEHLLDTLLRELPRATWIAAGIGASEARVMEWVLARGADGVRTGLEDNIRVSKERLAAGDPELVRIAAEAVARHGRCPATPKEARRMLGLAAAG